VIFTQDDLNSLGQVIVKALRQPEPYIDIDRVVELTGIPKTTIYKYTSNRTIPHYKKGKEIRFKWSEVENWMQEASSASAR
jgi:excisionase family DNA binding protein